MNRGDTPHFSVSLSKGGGFDSAASLFLLFSSAWVFLIGIAFVRLVSLAASLHNHQPNSPTREVWWSQYIACSNMDTEDL